MASLDTLHDSYEQRWQRFLLWINPLGILAFVVCLILERPSQQYLFFDEIAYTIGAVYLSIIQVILIARPRIVRLAITWFVMGLASFFLFRITYLMLILKGGVDIPAQLSEGFYWIPVIYLLSLALPGSLFNKRIQFLFTLLFGVSASIFVGIALYQHMWDAAYALIQLVIANLAIFLLARAFASYKDDLIGTQVKLFLTEQFAYTDAVTQLPNRSRLEQYLHEHLTIAKAEGSSFAVLFIDFDNFKLINDLLGHEAGDQVLKATSQRMLSVLGAGDFLARQSGDEFVVVSAHNANHDELERLAERLREAIFTPLTIHGEHAQLTASIGVSYFSDSTQTAIDLLRQADAAMYRVKNSGKNGSVFFDNAIDNRSETQFIEQDIRYALERQETYLVAQPILNLHTGKIVRFEVLARWHHTQRGPISPGLFIPAAERNGFIVPLGEWVLREACLSIKPWLEPYPDLKISVNVSKIQLAHPDFLNMIHRVLAETGLPAQNLDLEMTESVLDSNPEQTHHILSQLRQLGIGLLMDDFGKGYSSLAYLKDFPFDVIKLDRGFINDLNRDSQSDAYSRAILSGVNQIAKHLNLDLVAEGIETAEQLHICKELGYNLGQGFFFSSPVSISKIPELLEQEPKAELFHQLEPNLQRLVF